LQGINDDERIAILCITNPEFYGVLALISAKPAPNLQEFQAQPRRSQQHLCSSLGLEAIAYCNDYFSIAYRAAFLVDKDRIS
jgi:hypothetical protein